MFFFPTFSSILHLGLIDIHPCACFFLVCPSVNSGGIGSGGGERITAMEFTSRVIPSALWVFNTTTTTTKCSGADNSLRLPIFFIRVCGNFSQRVKCKADQISHFCLLVDIKERPRMCKTKKGEKRKQSVKQRGGARRNTKTQTQKSRKAKSQEHSCKMSQLEKGHSRATFGTATSALRHLIAPEYLKSHANAFLRKIT